MCGTYLHSDKQSVSQLRLILHMQSRCLSQGPTIDRCSSNVNLRRCRTLIFMITVVQLQWFNLPLIVPF